MRREDGVEASARGVSRLKARHSPCAVKAKIGPERAAPGRLVLVARTASEAARTWAPDDRSAIATTGSLWSAGMPQVVRARSRSKPAI